MEKYIKVLENYIDEYIEPYIFENDNYDELDEMREAIENLIKGYRELEKTNKNLIEYRQALEKDLFENCSNFVISKDKIREKIDELNKKEKVELKGTKGQDRYSIKLEYMYKRAILEELLEED